MCVGVTQRIHSHFNIRSPTLAFRFAVIVRGDRWRIHFTLIDDVSFAVAMPCMRINQTAGRSDPPILGEVSIALRTGNTSRYFLILCKRRSDDQEPTNYSRFGQLDLVNFH